MTRRVPSLPALRGAVAAGIAVVTLLGGCTAVPTTRFHTLLPAAGSAGPQVAPAGPLAWEVLPVNIPAQVDQPQWVVRAADGSLAVLEQERWIAPLADELQGALSAQLQRASGLPPPTALPDGRPWRVAVEVLRWDARLGHFSRIEARWQVGAGSAVLRHCAVTLEQPALGGLEALAAAHRAVVARLGDAIAQSLSGC